MTPEQTAWKSIKPVLDAVGLDPRRVENIAGPGHPDVNYAGGDIELKALSSFPARPSTYIEVPHYTGEQAGWLGRRWRSMGLAWLFVRVGREWFLFDGWTAMAVKRGMTTPEWQEQAALHFPAPIKGWDVAMRMDGRPYSLHLRDWLRFDLDELAAPSRARAMRLRTMQTVEHVATDLGWPPELVQRTETGLNPAGVNRLLDYWNS